jgi:hypothetical protein
MNPESASCHMPIEHDYINRSFIFDQFVFGGGFVIVRFAMPFFSCTVVDCFCAVVDEDDVLPASSAAYIKHAAARIHRKYFCILTIYIAPELTLLIIYTI